MNVYNSDVYNNNDNNYSLEFFPTLTFYNNITLNIVYSLLNIV